MLGMGLRTKLTTGRLRMANMLGGRMVCRLGGRMMCGLGHGMVSGLRGMRCRLCLVHRLGLRLPGFGASEQTHDSSETYLQAHSLLDRLEMLPNNEQQGTAVSITSIIDITQSRQ